MNSNTSTIQTVIIILLVVALIIAVWGWVGARNQLSLAEVSGGLGGFRTEIQIACADTASDAGQSQCADKLQEFSDTLQTYEAALANLNGSSGLATSTTATGR